MRPPPAPARRTGRAAHRRRWLRLDLQHREPLVLQVLLGYSTEEIAQQLQLSLPAVLTRLYRARQILRKQLLGDACDTEPRV